MSTSSASSFLPHVNGIRALAILGVLIYHLNAAYCPTGYFGVDVFLVISGYFIFRGLMNSDRVATFRYGSYLLGKAWRLLPSWFVCVVVVVMACVLLMAPNDARHVFNTAATSSLFASNLYVDFCYDYFNPTAHLNTLLHLWYLCVVIHMYVLAPLLVIPLVRRNRQKTAMVMIAGLSIASLILYALTTGDWLDADAKTHLLTCIGAKSAYYHLITRFWEFGAGCFVCMLPAWTERVCLRNLLAIAGFAGVVLSFMVFKIESPNSYLAVGSAMFLMRYGDTGTCSRVLSWKPLQLLGTISFSLYLWHWPVMVIWKYYCFSSILVWDEVAMLAISMLLGSVAWWGVERRAFPVASKGIWRVSVVMLLPLMFCLAALVRYCIPRDRSVDACIIEGVTRKAGSQDEALLAHFDLGVFSRKPVYLGEDTGETPVFMLVGDSHALHLQSGMHKACSRMGMRGCALDNHVVLMWGHYKQIWSAAKEEALLVYLQHHPEIRYAVISMYWTNRFFAERVKTKAYYERCLLKTCSVLNDVGVKVVLLADVPTYDRLVDPLSEWARKRHIGVEQPDVVAVSEEEHMKRETYSRGVLDRLLQGRVVHAVIDASVPLFEKGDCLSRIGEQFVYRDAHHLTPYGSEIVGEYVAQQMKAIISKDSAEK